MSPCLEPFQIMGVPGHERRAMSPGPLNACMCVQYSQIRAYASPNPSPFSLFSLSAVSKFYANAIGILICNTALAAHEGKRVFMPCIMTNPKLAALFLSVLLLGTADCEKWPASVRFCGSMCTGSLLRHSTPLCAENQNYTVGGERKT